MSYAVERVNVVGNPTGAEGQVGVVAGLVAEAPTQTADVLGDRRRVFDVALASTKREPFVA